MARAAVCNGACRGHEIFRAEQRVGLGDVALALGTGVVALVAATIDRYDAARDWLAYHTLIGGWLTVVGVSTLVACVNRKRQPDAVSAGWSAC